MRITCPAGAAPGSSGLSRPAAERPVLRGPSASGGDLHRADALVGARRPRPPESGVADPESPTGYRRVGVADPESPTRVPPGRATGVGASGGRARGGPREERRAAARPAPVSPGRVSRFPWLAGLGPPSGALPLPALLDLLRGERVDLAGGGPAWRRAPARGRSSLGGARG